MTPDTCRAILRTMLPFDGLIAYPITPADAGGQVDTPALTRLLERLANAGVGGIGLLGSTGTYPYLTRTERRRAVEAAVEAVAGRAPLLVGVGALFPFAKTSALVKAVQDDVPGRLLVFFPGTHEHNVYRLLDARDGWNYMAVPITPDDGPTGT